MSRFLVDTFHDTHDIRTVLGTDTLERRCPDYSGDESTKDLAISVV
jgi:hypothetical protein